LSRSKSIKYYILFISLALVAGGLVLNTYLKWQPLDQEEYLKSVENRLADEIATMQRQMVDVLEYVEQNKSSDFTNLNIVTKYPFYVFSDSRLEYWSDYRYVPEYRFLKGDYRYRFTQTIRKDFIARKWEVSGTSYEIYSILPLYNNYKVDNNYVQSGFNTSIFSDQKLTLMPITGESEGTQVCLGSDNQCLFKVNFAQDYIQNRVALNYTVSGLIALGAIGFVFWLYAFVRGLRHEHPERGLLILVTSLTMLRAIMLLSDFPKGLIESDLFDSRFFASSAINPSLGDLLLNLGLTLVVIIYVFNNYYNFDVTKKLLKVRGALKPILTVVLSGLMLFILHIEYLLFQTIYHNSQLTFDINQSINFDPNRVVAFVVFLLLGIIIFLVHHIFFKVVAKINTDRLKLVLFYLVGVVTFSVANLIIGQDFIVVVFIGVAWATILFLTKLPGYLSKIRYNTFLYFFSSIITISLIGAFAIFQFENEREYERKHKFVTQFLIENDNLAEYLLNEVNQKLEDDVFIQSTMASPFLSKNIIKSKIRQVYLSNYFDKYDVNIYLYNSSGQPFEEKQGQLQADEIKKFNVKDYQTDYEGIYYVNKLGGEVTKRYLDFIEVKKRGITVGFIILDLTLKRIIPDNVYPELLVDNAFLFPYQDANYSYAVYDNNEIVYNSGNYNYYTDFSSNLLAGEAIYKRSITINGYSHLAVKDPGGRVIVISSNLHPWSDIISNFSFLFLIQVFMLLILTAIYTMYFSFQNASLNYSARIQLYLNVAFFLPLFAVSITTLSLINSSFKKEVNEEYYRKARSISSNVSDDLDDYVRRISENREELPNKLSQVAKFSGVDVNLFNVRGRLLATSQPLIYENNLLSPYLNPEAFAKIKEQEENVYIAREAVGSLEFNTTYYGVKSYETGSLIGVLSIPFFQSEYALEQNQIEVLSNVINIFTIIFIVFLLISYLAAKWLTFPLYFITQKLKKTTLTGFNEPLVWKADDEIGLMVGEYNRMLINLEESKKALARSEKESAWREIAQQVAHEIKNPLTPMKLTLQHLSRKLIGRSDEKELEKPIATLLHEIETLNDIATSFSSFAKLPIPENERFEFLAVVNKTVNLHSATKGVTIDLQVPDQEVYTIGDEQLMSRIISNIIINAIQASDTDMQIDVIVHVIDNRKLLLEVKDNGPGIDPEIHSKIFVPNFSTKDTGSGIGLAIAKHGVEHAGGKIWFETNLGEGTSFFIELPMVE